MTTHHKKMITSRFVLVMAVVVASFLAAFLGQVLITQLSLSPSILPQPGIIVRSSGFDAATLRARAQTILSREGSAFVQLFATKDPLSLSVDGWVVSSDGWVVYLEQRGFTPAFVRLDSGVTLPITKTVVDPASALRFVKIEQDRLNPVTLAQSESLEPLETVLAFSSNGLYSATHILESLGIQNQVLVSTDLLARTPHVVSQSVVGSALYDDNSDFVGLVSLSDARTSMVIPASHIRSRLLNILRDATIESPSLGILYIDLGTYPSSAVNETAGAWIPPQSYATASVIPTTSAAYKGGLRSGDVVTAVDGIPLSERFTLSDSVMESKVGETHELTVSRRGTPLTLTVEIEAAN